MNAGKYALRSAKYFIKLAVLLGLLFVIMQRTGTSNLDVGTGGFLSAFFSSTRGQLFVVVLLVWCAIYPKVEFVRRHLSWDMDTHREAIVKAMRDGAMVQAGDVVSGATNSEAASGGAAGGGTEKIVFRGESPIRRIWFMGDEAVTITRSETGGFDVEGPRRFVMELQHRIARYV